MNLAQKFSLFTAHWQPKIVGEVNDCHVKLTKLKGEFVWHLHEMEDEMFLVVRGNMVIRFRDQEVALNEGEFIIIPRGVEHMPAAEEEVHVMVFEPASTVNTGNQQNERTMVTLEKL